MTNDKIVAKKLPAEGSTEDAVEGSDDENIENPVVGAPIGAIVARQQTYSGPIPPASEMKAYDEASPGLADRIMKVYENQQ